MKISKVIFCIILLVLFSSCKKRIKRGSDLSSNHIGYIKSLGVLSDNENIILFDSWGRIKLSGNFFSDKRIAAYWTSEKVKGQPKIEYAFYKDIDSISPHLIKALTYSSYLEVYKTNGQKFKVYVAADSVQTKDFFERAIAEWQKNK